MYINIQFLLLGRQRLASSSEDHTNVSLRLSAHFAPPRAWIDNLPHTRDMAHSKQVKPVDSLFIMSCHGSLIQYDLDPHAGVSIPKDKICDESPIELSVSAKAQWVLQRQGNSTDISLPMFSENIHLIYQEIPMCKVKGEQSDDRWLSQVEIVTHSGPHRRLWMGPQFTFKTYSNNNGYVLLYIIYIMQYQFQLLLLISLG